MGIDADIAGKAFDMSFSYIATQVVVGSVSSGAKALTSGNGAGSVADDVASLADDAVGAGNGAVVDSRKFSDYIFKDGVTHGKDIVYKNLGYSANESEMLTRIYQEQGAAKYASGNYTLGKLNEFGQRINIEIELNGIGNATGKTSYLNSGWMIKPNGSISLNTPFSGFTK